MSCKYECMKYNDNRCCFECENNKTCLNRCTEFSSNNLNVNNYKLCKEYIKNEEKQIDYETDTKEVVSKDFPEVIYFVKLKDRYTQELHKTKVVNVFAGTIVNQTASSLYFELKDTKELVIIPHKYILWLAPVKEKN